MRNIKYVLTERWYTWENARTAAMEDPEINLYADAEKGERVFNPIEQDPLEASEDTLEAENDASRLSPEQIPTPDNGVGGGREVRV
jgi:large subunit ribosomal protein L47